MVLSLQAQGVVITHASNVRLRAGAAETASVLAALPVGTELTAQGASIDGRWRRVRTAEGVEGFVDVSLVRDVPVGKRLGVIEAIIGERLAREGDSYPARVELLALVERAARDATDADARGRLALDRLRATMGVLDAIGFRYDARRVEPYASWLKAREDAIAYNEPGGRWMIRHQAIVAVHDAHRTSASADDIAWLAATNGLGGECEGDHACNAFRTNELWGGYLQRHPRGRHVAEALRVIADEVFSDVPTPPAPLVDLNPKPDCTGIIKALTPLRAAVSATEALRKSDALAAIDRLRAHCK